MWHSARLALIFIEQPGGAYLGDAFESCLAYLTDGRRDQPPAA